MALSRPMVSNIMQMPRMQRGTRRPSHNWFVKNPPFCFQPCMMVPVLPGETLKSARWQARGVTDPIKGRLLGWWLEHYLFYVPISAMNLGDPEDLKFMFIDASATIAENVTRSDTNYLNDDGTVTSYDWVTECVVPIINRWFRTRNTVAGTYYFGAGAPPGNDRWYKVKCEAPGWTDSLTLQSTDTGLDVDLIDAASTDVLTASELDIAMRTWELHRLQGLTQQTYEEFLMTYRVRVPADPNVGEPELLRYSRAWQYPSNTVVPTTGAVTTAVSWTVSESADKDRRFKEPGFIIMGTCARPKVYFSKQTSFAASQMTDAFAWLPATLWDQARVGIRKLDNDQMVKDGGAIQFDVKDLMVYGDQFLNALDYAEANMVALPDNVANVEYVADADIKAMFSSDTVFMVTQDGHCELTIASSTTDPEPVKLGAGV